MATGSKAVIKNADMSEEMQADAIDCATQVRRMPCAVGLRVPCDSQNSQRAMQAANTAHMTPLHQH